MSIICGNNIENIWEICCISNEFHDSGEFFFLKAVNVIDCNNNRAANLTERFFYAIMIFTKGLISKLLERMAVNGLINGGIVS